MSDKFHFSPRENKANEINWREWGQEAFKEAKDNDKLILLSISAVWCHWCHVMDETSYSYKPNINLINDQFIPIRVDNDKRPDVNKLFNMGGWPTTVVLTPDGDILNGGTYMPEKTLYSFLTNTNRYYKLNKHKADYIGKNDIRFEEPVQSIKNKDFSEDILKEIDNIILKNYDSHYGGFGIEPKFPHTDTLDYLVHRFFNNQEDSMFKIVIKTLDSMANGGIYDHEEGGFFRYSTTRDWSIPHYEKMLEDNAKLLDVYLKVFQITNKGKYLNTCNGIIDYLNSYLLDVEKGVFFGSQDADEHYYGLPKEQRKGKNTPYIDKTIYTNWNALAVSAYTRAYYVLDNPDCLNIAQRCMSFLISNCFDSKDGMCHYYSDSPKMNGILEDQIYTINALIDLYEATSQNKYIYNATNLADLVLEKYYDSKNNGFFDDIVEYDFAPSIKKGEKSIDINSFCAQVFFRLYDYSELKKYKDVAQETLQLFNNLYKSYSFFASSFGRSVLRHLSQPVKISIVGDTNDKSTNDMIFESLKRFIPYKVLEFLDITKDRQRIELNGYNFEQSPAGYICKGEKCLNPVFSPKDMANILQGSEIQ